MRHVVIWALPRTGSTALGRALGALNEPLQLEGQNFAPPAEIRALCAGRQSIKHLYEECPDDSNLALAHEANCNGYRNIHLVRCNEFARLLSRDIATQREAWTPDLAAERFAELRDGRAKLAPVNVDHLMRLHRIGCTRWRAIREQIVGPILTVKFEDITSPDKPRRHAAFRMIARYLDLSIERLRFLEDIIAAGNLRTQTVWSLAPNVGHLRQSLIAAGVL